MSVFKKIVNSFKYEPKKQYNFALTTDEEKESNITYEEEIKEDKPTVKNVYSNLGENLKYIKTKFNTLINSDIVVREFNVYAKNNIDGLTDTQMISDFVIKPLMIRNNANTFNPNNNTNNNTNNNNNNNLPKATTSIDKKKYPIVHIKKKNSSFNLCDYIFNFLLPQNDVKKTKDFSELVSGINSGNCALFIDTINYGFDIDVKSFQQRSVNVPNNANIPIGNNSLKSLFLLSNKSKW